MSRAASEVLMKWGEDYGVVLVVAVMTLAVLLIAFYKAMYIDVAFALVGQWWSAIIVYYFTKKKESVK